MGNPALVRMLGYASREELLAVPVPELYADPAQRAAEISELDNSTAVRQRELRLRTKTRRGPAWQTGRLGAIPLPYALLYNYVPGFGAIRVPVRFPRHAPRRY